MKNWYLILILVTILVACNEKKVTIIDHSQIVFTEIADTIITDVVIKNPDQNEWTAYTLRNLDKDVLVEQIFNLVYSGELKPYDFFNETEMTIEDIKALEKEEDNLMDRVGKVQFEEAWYFDAESKKMVKHVHSIMLAYEFYESNGEVRGYKPIFKVYLNN